MRFKSLDERINEALRVRRIAEHRSTGDWDYSSTDWELDTSDYVSAPSSFRNTTTIAVEVLVKTTTVPIANVKEGRVVSQVRFSHVAAGVDGILKWIFRYQDVDNYYYTTYNANTLGDRKFKIYRRKAGADTLLDEVLWTISAATWYKLRVTWWNDYVGLVIRVERWTGTEWAFMVDGYDAENNWKTIGGRVGFNVDCPTLGMHINIDDTDIFGLPP